VNDSTVSCILSRTVSNMSQIIAQFSVSLWGASSGCSGSLHLGAWGGHNCSWGHGPILPQWTTPNKW